MNFKGEEGVKRLRDCVANLMAILWRYGSKGGSVNLGMETDRANDGVGE